MNKTNIYYKINMGFCCTKQKDEDDGPVEYVSSQDGEDILYYDDPFQTSNCKNNDYNPNEYQPLIYSNERHEFVINSNTNTNKY
jgi:hypothetical protein